MKKRYCGYCGKLFKRIGNVLRCPCGTEVVDYECIKEGEGKLSEQK